MRRDKRPTWWMLYVIGLALMILFLLADMYVSAGSLRSVIESALVIAAFASMSMWRRHNRIALDLQGRRPR
jgi:hypothetical protein